MWSAARVPSAGPELVVCADFLAHVRGGAAATDDERAVLLEALEASRTAQDLASDEGVAQGTADLGGHGDRGVA